MPLELREDSYVDVILHRHSGEPIGRIVLLSKKPLTNRELAEAALKIVAVCAAGELERTEAENARWKSEAQYRRIVNTAREGIWELDKNWRTVFVNPHIAVMLGYEPDEMLGRIIDDFIHVDDLDDHLQRKLERQLGKDGQYERKFNSKDGREIWTIVSATASTDHEGRFSGSFLMLTDITKRKNTEVEKEKIEAQLIQAQKMESIGRLAGGVAHDFNNMLSVILGNTELALEQAKGHSDVHAELTEIKKATMKLVDLTRRLLAFARKQTASPMVINLNHIIDGMLKMLRRLIGEDIKLTWLPKKDLPPVFIDPSQVDQILANLCVNSRDAIQSDGTIIIETKNITITEGYCRENVGFKPGEYVLLSFSDNGCGIKKEDMKHIFEPFFTTKAQSEGTGLGLAVVYGIVKQNNGFIHFYSEPGRGTTCRIFLPQHPGKTHMVNSDEISTIPNGQGETILLVEFEL